MTFYDKKHVLSCFYNKLFQFPSYSNKKDKKVGLRFSCFYITKRGSMALLRNPSYNPSALRTVYPPFTASHSEGKGGRRKVLNMSGVVKQSYLPSSLSCPDFYPAKAPIINLKDWYKARTLLRSNLDMCTLCHFPTKGHFSKNRVAPYKSKAWRYESRFSIYECGSKESTALSSLGRAIQQKIDLPSPSPSLSPSSSPSPPLFLLRREGAKQAKRSTPLGALLRRASSNSSYRLEREYPLLQGNQLNFVNIFRPILTSPYNIKSNVPRVSSLVPFSKLSGESSVLGLSPSEQLARDKNFSRKGGLSEEDKKKRKKYYTSYSKLSEVKLLTIGIASPLRILQWAEKTLPNGKIYGEVLNANTLHHKTFKPQKGGLFCERIFGPLKDFECACGKIDKSSKQSQILFMQESSKKNQQGLGPTPIESPVTVPLLQNIEKIGAALPDSPYSTRDGKQVQDRQTNVNRKFCPDCDVEYTWSVIRRYQLGYIKLCSPVTHIWFLKGTPSYLSLLLDMKKRYLQFITYCSEILTIEKSSLPIYSVGNVIKSNAPSLLSLSKSQEQEQEERILGGCALSSPCSSFPGGVIKEGCEAEQHSVEKKREITQKQSKRLIKPPIPKKGWHERSCSEAPLGASPFDFANENLQTNFSKSQKPNSGIPSILLIPKEKDFKKGISILSIFSLIRIQSFYCQNLSSLDSVLAVPLIQIKKSEPFLSKNKSFAIKATFNNQKVDSHPSLLASQPRSKSRDGWETQPQEGSDLLKKLPNFKNLSKKMPIDLYILCILERMLHKSSLTLSIQNTWKSLAKQAFIKAINKAKFIFAPLRLYPLTASTQALLKKGCFLRSKAPQGRCFAQREKEALQKQGSGEKLSYKIEQNDKETKTTDFVLKNFKIKFMNHVFKLLENIKYPLIPIIVSLNYTTNFLQKNRFCWVQGQPSQIEKQISSEIESFLLKNTTNTSIFLTKFFLNSFLLDFYLNNSINKSLLQLPSSLPAKHPSHFSPSEGSPSEGSPSEGGEEQRSEAISDDKGKKVSKSLIKMTLNLKKDLKNKNQKSVLNAYQNFLKIKSASEGFPKKEDLSSLKAFFPLSPSTIRASSKKRSGSALCNQIGTQKKLSFLQSIAAPLYNSNPGGASFAPGKELFTKIKERAKVGKGTNSNPKNLYNNVYTLSHRERWDIEKDWQIFTLFTFGTTEYFDFPIYTYKNRFFSFLNSENYTSMKLPPRKPSLTTDSSRIVPYETQGRSLLPPSLGTSPLTGVIGSAVRAEYTEPSLSLSSSFYSGAGIVQQLLNEFDFYEIKKLDTQNRLILYQLNQSILKLKKQVQIFVYDKTAQIEFKELCKKRDLLIRRTKLVRKLFRKNSNPTSMVLTLVPVLPPDLRPIVKMGSQIAASDLNRLYQRVIYRNDRLKKFLKDPATSQSYEMKYAQRLLQEAVDNLLQNGKSGPNSEKDARGRALKSLSDVLKGKQGRFRQFLLGKRVDYSGRSVIVVGPKLKLHECGLPLEMAKELYLPFLLKSILNKNYAKTVIGAKTLIQKNSSLAHELLREIMQVSPLLLNRAPTLHRLGIQAFVPKLIEGRAILLHPLVCSAFNADFDGDQMAVHIPITVEARAEAWKIMLSRNNILSTATGDPLAIPSQDMVLGCYYLTTLSNHGKILRGSGMYLNSLNDVIKVYEQRLIDVHSLVWVKWTNFIENGTDQEDPLEIRLSSFGQWQEITSNSHRIYDSHNNLINQYICTTPGRILFNLIIQNTILN